ncbi:MAG: hypothetical protein ACUVXB_17090, partial [Bryobacteraceae bacterium]
TGAERYVWGWEPSGIEWRYQVSLWPPENRDGIPEQYFTVARPPWKAEFRDCRTASWRACHLLAAAEADTDEATTAQAGRRKPHARSRAKGRPKADYATVQREQDIAARWERAKAAGVTLKDFAKDQRRPLRDLKALLDRVRKRKRAAE